MFVVLGVATGPKEKGLLAGVAIGGVIAFEACWIWRIDEPCPIACAGSPQSRTVGYLDLFTCADSRAQAIGVLGHKAIT